MSDETKTAADETNAVAGETKAPAPPRRLTLHRVPGLNEAITIEVLDQPGAGGACHVYALSYRNDAPPDILRFQEGPPAAGVNGYSIEALLVIAIDRLSGFQSGPGKCEENEFALDAIGQALNALHGRTGRLLDFGPGIAVVEVGERDGFKEFARTGVAVGPIPAATVTPAGDVVPGEGEAKLEQAAEAPAPAAQ